MADRNALRIDGMLASELSGPEKVAALLRARGYTFASFAREHGFWPEQVKMAVYGTRAYPDVREALAAELGLAREEIDRLIDRPAGDSSAPSDRGAA